jgi:hypothetical protein
VSAPRQVRAPTHDGAIVAAPPLAEAEGLIRANLRSLYSSALSVGGQPWLEFRSKARQSLLRAVRQYLGQRDEPAGIRPDARGIVMAGHQPELFHPGVWVKNFALNGLAKKLGFLPVNLVVDNDSVKSTVLHFPEISEPPHRSTIPFDTPSDGEPYEERTVLDARLFESLPQRLQPHWPFEPLLGQFWKEAVRIGERTPLLGERFAGARRVLEREWGCFNLEVPVSSVCQTEPFARFATDLLLHLPRFHGIYNVSVQQYRDRYGLRSKSHPVPDLSSEGDWLETPFWAWRAGQTRRGRLLARLSPETIELRVGAEPWPALPREPEALLKAFLDLAKQGLKVRSRALTNTMYARLFLCDLFVHGIGGGKYDEVTDSIIRGYYGVEPPAYLVLSATLLLPLPTYPTSPEEVRRLRREERDLIYNPQRHLTAEQLAQPEIAALVARKSELMGQEPVEPQARRTRFRALQEVTGRLRVFVADDLQRARQGLVQCEQQVRANEVLQRRDYAFCLYPENTLRSFCEQFLSIRSTTTTE